MPQIGDIYITSVPEYELDNPIIIIVSCEESRTEYAINWNFYNEKRTINRNRKWSLAKEEFHREWRLLSPVEKEMYEA
jgi:hypothetical protein